MNIKGIKCDNPNCDYRDDSIKKEDYLSFVNKPCPKCGSNLLTQKDYDTVILLERILKSWPIRLIDSVVGLFKKPMHFEAKMNGSGKIELVEIKPEDKKD